MLVVTIDLDWAPEPAIEETLDFFQERGIRPTVFATHQSRRVMEAFDAIEVGLHPFFHPNSSHGSTMEKVIETVFKIPHNTLAYRCHRFATCNTSKQLMAEAGMKISSNVCTNLEVIPPFNDRFGLTEVPIFFEDGAYLWNQHPLVAEFDQFNDQMLYVMIVHPMHFVINTPNFEYMVKLKQKFTRDQWRHLSKEDIGLARWRGRGIRHLITELICSFDDSDSLARSIAKLS